ncbi:hypothetical protein PTKIN_Ptkin14bG0163500 [Pterospermum kingtungense]
MVSWSSCNFEDLEFICSMSWLNFGEVWSFPFYLGGLPVRLVTWAEAKRSQVQMTYLSLNCAPADMSIPVKKHSTRPVCCWLKLNVGEVKFNVDGPSIGKPGLQALDGY